ncbi:long-chain fatty acid--CoA ligase [Roseomonas eburnea]|uniref:Long-chain fatty acid--CoA ligase n=1 Tax=Neoroseomonas eburnea TaxID=1346889 RepID=A0A9X9XB63_9PROT|nr:AMP-binding protein [Neoroseomonas eburnea]MBR0680949.1 long-chain fatty acid--CoA ligase [Neoroseomonas eburnea]
MIRTDLIAPLSELLARHASARGGKTAFRDSARSVTWAELASRSGNLAARIAAAGVRPGDRVALLLPNSVAWIESACAILRAGAVNVPISHDATVPEILYRLEDAGCRAVVVSAERAGVIAEARASLPALLTVIVAGNGAGELEALSAGVPPMAPPDPPLLEEPAFIIYTSGTTGRAKGVILTLRGMLWVTAACWAPILGLSEQDEFLSPLPLFHSYGLNLAFLSVVATGASVRIMERYSTGEARRLLAEERPTLFAGVPTMFHYLLQAIPEGEAAVAPRLTRSVSAGAIMPGTLNRAWEDRFGSPLLDGYGITETCTMVTMNWMQGGRPLGSCGLPLPGLTVRLLDPASGEDAAPGAEGELIVRGPNVMLGYHNKPAETAQALRKGWYHTGDLARADADGFLTITGRLKELIIRGGQNIAPAEIEEVAAAFPGVRDCAVIAAPHAELGEVPVLFVAEKPGERVNIPALIAACRRALSAYKVPQSVQVTDEIPRTGSGKIMRFRLKEQLPR